MPDQNAKAILNDICTEELAHLEMVGTIVHQLTKNASIEEIEAAGLSPYMNDGTCLDMKKNDNFMIL